MSTANITLFDDEFLKKLEYLNIISKRLFAGQLRADRRTRKRVSRLKSERGEGPLAPQPDH